MVVHGRNAAARDAMFEFLRSLDLLPLEWSALVAGAASGSPYIGQVLDDAFAQAQAVVVLSTPDDLARLHRAFVDDVDNDGEAELRGQARPNVFFEAGMAFGRFPTRTILTELGDLRAASDLGGRHAVRLSQSAECRKDLAQRLRNAGCHVKMDGVSWLSAGDFEGAISDAALADTEQQLQDLDTRDPQALALVRRIDALRADLGEARTRVAWNVARIYNDLLASAQAMGCGEALVPAVQRSASVPGPGPSGRRLTNESTVHSDEIRIALGQLREELS
jgi:hypothetical protein